MANQQDMIRPLKLYFINLKDYNQKLLLTLILRESALWILATESSCTMPHILKKVLYLLSFLVTACNVYKCAKTVKMLYNKINHGSKWCDYPITERINDINKNRDFHP